MNDNFINYQRNCKTNEFEQFEEFNHELSFFIRVLRGEYNFPLHIPTIEEAAKLEHGQLPAFVGTGKYSGTRSGNNIEEWNHLIWLDVDCEKSVKYSKPREFFLSKIHYLTSNVFQYDNIFNPFETEEERILKGGTDKRNIAGWMLSKSGKGFRIICKVPKVHDIKKEELPEYYNTLYLALKVKFDTLFQKNGMKFFKVDTQAADISHPFSVVKDPNAKFDPTKELPSEFIEDVLVNYKIKNERCSLKYEYKYDKEKIRNVNLSNVNIKTSRGVFDSFDSRITLANTMSWMFGNEGLSKYKEILVKSGESESQFEKEYKHFYKTGLNRSKNLNQKDMKALMMNISSFFGIKDFITDIEVQDKQYKTVKYNKYLTEKKDHILQELLRQKRIIIDSETGSGKTTLAEELSKEITIDFLCPTTSIAEQQTGVVFVGSDRLKGEDKSSPIVYTTYENVDKLRYREAECLVVDEAHHLIQDYKSSFRQAGIEKVYKAFSRYRHIILLSATPDCLDMLDDFHLLKFEKVNRNFINLYENTELEHLVKNVQKDELLAIYINDRNKGERTKKELLTMGFSDDEIQVIHSEKRSSDDYQYILNKQEIDEKVKVLICTKFLAEGININNNYKKVSVYYPDTTNTSFAEIKQFSARFRNVKNIEIHTNTFSDNKNIIRSVPSYIELLYDAEQATSVIETASSPFSDTLEEACLKAITGNDSLFKVETVTLDVKGTIKVKKVVVDELALAHQNLSNLNQIFRNFPKQRERTLRKYGIIRNQKKLQTNDLWKKIDIEEKESKKTSKKFLRENIASWIGHKTGLNKQQKEIKKQFNELLQYNVDDSKALELISSEGAKKVNQVIKQFYWLENKKALEEKKLNYTKEKHLTDFIIMKGVYDLTKICIKQGRNEFTQADICKLFNKVKEEKISDWSTVRHFNCTEKITTDLFKLMFKVKCERVRTGNNKQIRKQIVLDEISEKDLKKYLKR